MKRRHGRGQGSVKLTVSQAATLTFGFERRKGKRWVALTRTLTARVRAGAPKIGFSVHGLSAGRYRLTVLATNSVGERSRPEQATSPIKR